MSSHRDALISAVNHVWIGVSGYEDTKLVKETANELEAAISKYMKDRNVVMVPRERIEKLLSYSGSDYVPNVLFSQFRQFLSNDTAEEKSQ